MPPGFSVTEWLIPNELVNDAGAIEFGSVEVIDTQSLCLFQKRERGLLGA